ncbi:MAG: FkbM family methyltransferase [Candidatus Methylomirabilales bacterium]
MLRNVPVFLRCGVTVRADLRHPEWAKVAGRGYHELGTERFLVDYLQPGDVVIDVGAHIGMLTAVASKLVGTSGKVYAFEVDAINFDELIRTIRRNHLRNVKAENIGLSDRSGVFEFVRPKDSWGSFMLSHNDTFSRSQNQSALSKIFGCREKESYTRPAITIDEYIHAKAMNRCNLIKIDVDGPELAILNGAANSLARYRPALIVEASMFNLDHGVSFDDMFSFLTEQDYSLFAAVHTEDNVVSIRTPTDLPVDILHDTRSVNLFCLPLDVHKQRWRNLWFPAG